MAYAKSGSRFALRRHNPLTTLLLRLDQRQQLLSRRRQRKRPLLVAGLHRKHLQLKQEGIKLLTSQSDQIFEVMDPGRPPVGQHNPGLEYFSTACWAVKPQSSSG